MLALVREPGQDLHRPVPNGRGRVLNRHGRQRGLPERCPQLGAPVTLAWGEHDAMSTSEQLARLDVPAVTLPGLGHNAHVESPDLSITLLDPYR